MDQDGATIGNGGNFPCVGVFGRVVRNVMVLARRNAANAMLVIFPRKFAGNAQSYIMHIKLAKGALFAGAQALQQEGVHLVTP